MNRNKLILNIVLVIVIYFVVQFACSIIFMGISFVMKLIQEQKISGSFGSEILHDTLGWILIVSSVITVILLALFRKVFLKDEFRWNGCEVKYIPFVLIACVAGVLGLDILSEILKLPNLIEADMISMSKTFDGALAIGLVGPIAEEIVFRGAICGGMLKAGVRPWTAIIVSAVIFGCVHVNPAQIPFAAMVGLMLAILYYKTGSLIPCSIIHVLNNSWAVVMMNIYADQPNITFSEIFGQINADVILVAGLSLGTYMFYMYWKKKRVEPTANS